jgi:hypothetical protein
MIDAEKVALARAVMNNEWRLRNDDSGWYCPYCAASSYPHQADCPVPIAQRVIAESERGK